MHPLQELVVAKRPVVEGGVTDRLDDIVGERRAEERAVLLPAEAREKRMRGHELVTTAQGHAAVAGPPITRRVEDDAGAHRVRLDVSLGVGQVRLGLHQRRTVTPFPQRAGAPVRAIDIGHVVAAHRLDHPRDA